MFPDSGGRGSQDDAVADDQMTIDYGVPNVTGRCPIHDARGWVASRLE